jgi:hypothetical protein
MLGCNHGYKCRRAAPQLGPSVLPPAAGALDADERKVATALSTALAAEYATIADEAAAARRLDTAGRRKAVGRLRRELRQVRARDHFPPRTGSPP